MSLYPLAPSGVTLTAGEGEAAELLGEAGIVAVRLVDLASPAGRGLGRSGRTALVATGAGEIRTGDMVVFCKPVAAAEALVRRDGRVQAGGHPADHARLGILEQQLDAVVGTGAIAALARSAALGGKVTGTAKRAMTTELAIRFTVLTTLMPEADYTEVVAALLADLPLVPWHKEYTPPTATVVSTWRAAVGPAPLEKLRERVLAAVDAEHQARGEWVAKVGDLDSYSVDGSLYRVPDSPANRAAFGSAGTADDSVPYPQRRDLLLNAAATRATVGVVSGPAGAGAERDKGEAEQVLLDRALAELSFLFTANRIWIMDRNFPGVPRIRRMLRTGTHVLVRVKDGVTLRRVGPYLPDGSHLAEVSGGGATLVVRVVEYDATVAGCPTGETFCLVTDLLDHAAYPAHVLADAYRWRWVGSETTLKENKSTLHGAGPSTGAMLRSQSPDLVAQEHAAPPPRPQNQGTPRFPHRRPPPAHPHRHRPGQRLPPPHHLNHQPTPAAPCCCMRRNTNRPETRCAPT